MEDKRWIGSDGGDEGEGMRSEEIMLSFTTKAASEANGYLIGPFLSTPVSPSCKFNPIVPLHPLFMV